MYRAAADISRPDLGVNGVLVTTIIHNYPGLCKSCRLHVTPRSSWSQPCQQTLAPLPWSGKFKKGKTRLQPLVGETEARLSAKLWHSKRASTGGVLWHAWLSPRFIPVTMNTVNPSRGRGQRPSAGQLKTFSLNSWAKAAWLIPSPNTGHTYSCLFRTITLFNRLFHD